MFISGYANTQNVFDCLNAKGSTEQLSIFTTIQVNQYQMAEASPLPLFVG